MSRSKRLSRLAEGSWGTESGARSLRGITMASFMTRSSMGQPPQQPLQPQHAEAGGGVVADREVVEQRPCLCGHLGGVRHGGRGGDPIPQPLLVLAQLRRVSEVAAGE